MLESSWLVFVDSLKGHHTEGPSHSQPVEVMGLFVEKRVYVISAIASDNNWSRFFVKSWCWSCVCRTDVDSYGFDLVNLNSPNCSLSDAWSRECSVSWLVVKEKFLHHLRLLVHRFMSCTHVYSITVCCFVYSILQFTPGWCLLLISINVTCYFPFLPRDAMHKHDLCRHAVSVRLSICHVHTFCQNE